jgi:hypothetical protein
MRHMKTVDVPAVPATTKEVVDKVTCDICGKDANRDSWGSSSYEFDEVEVEITVKRREGENYPEGGSGTEAVIDVCPDCFVKKLVPWVESHGHAKIETSEWDW